MAIPSGWSSISLDELFDKLPNSDWQHIFAVYEKTQDMMQAQDELRSWFTEPARARHLEANGLDPRFANYMITFYLGSNYDIFRRAFNHRIATGIDAPSEDEGGDVQSFTESGS